MSRRPLRSRIRSRAGSPRLLAVLVIVSTTSCHRAPETKRPSEPLSPIVTSELTEAAESEIVTFCGGCHPMPNPASFPKSAWYDEVKRGFDFYYASNRKDLIAPPVQTVADYFRSKAPVALQFADDSSAAQPGPISFRVQQIPPASNEKTEQSPVAISFVSQWTTLEVTRQKRLIFNDMAKGDICIADPNTHLKATHCLGRVIHPAAACRCDLNWNGKPDLVVADLGSFKPADHNRGRVVWMPDVDEDRPAQPGIAIAVGWGRVPDVQPADFDGDGDVDFVVAEFGWHKTGHILWLRNEGPPDSPSFVSQIIDSRPGAIHVPITDLNHDGRPDFVALISQEFEVVEAFLNNGHGTFAKQTIHAAGDPAFGSSGIQITDIDGDGDLDVLHTNGDMFDSFLLKPYHGIQWLENQGTYPFQPHRLTSFPGVHRAR